MTHDEQIPDVAAARDEVVAALVGFARALRRAGAEVPANAAVTGARVLVETGFERRPARAGLRAALVSRREDLPAFERLFPEFWRRLDAALGADGAGEVDGDMEPEGSLAPLGATSDAEDAADAADAEDGEEGGPDDPADSDDRGGVEVSRRTAIRSTGDAPEGEAAAAYSPVGRSRPVDAGPTFAADDGLAAAVERLTGAIGTRRGRRWDRSREGTTDLRRALRRSVGTGGTVLAVPERARRRSAVRAVFLVDVSRSVLDAIDRGFLLRFLREASARWRSARVFFFDTDLAEVTEQFDAATLEDAVAALSRAEATWGGGTRIGHAVRTVREESPGAVDRTTTVFVVSDGLERGEIDALEEGMAWLSRRAGAVMWLNPLAASPEYEPACRGMAAALPYVDGLFAFTGPGDVAELARQLELHWPARSVGYEHDPRRTRASDA